MTVDGNLKWLPNLKQNIVEEIQIKALTFLFQDIFVYSESNITTTNAVRLFHVTNYYGVKVEIFFANFF